MSLWYMLIRVIDASNRSLNCGLTQMRFIPYPTEGERRCYVRSALLGDSAPSGDLGTRVPSILSSTVPRTSIKSPVGLSELRKDAGSPT